MRVISIDLGMNNFAAITNNIGKQPNLIRGKVLKAENQWYNKIAQPLKQQIKDTDDKLTKMYLSRKIHNLAKQSIKHIFEYFWSVSEWIIDYCIENDIDTVLIGQYKMLERQNYVTIPYGYFYQLLETRCKYHNIKYVLVKERYTSGTSFFDNEEPTKENYNKDRRIHNHLWQCNNGETVNADVNDSYQIMRKVYPQLFENGVDGYEKAPQVIDIRINRGGNENGKHNSENNRTDRRFG